VCVLIQIFFKTRTLKISLGKSVEVVVRGFCDFWTTTFKSRTVKFFAYGVRGIDVLVVVVCDFCGFFWTTTTLSQMLLLRKILFRQHLNYKPSLNEAYPYASEKAMCFTCRKKIFFFLRRCNALLSEDPLPYTSPLGFRNTSRPTPL